MIVHSGSSRSFGHYYSYCRGFESENQWYKCNDESVSKLNGIDGALGKQAYILFYQKRLPVVAVRKVLEEKSEVKVVKKSKDKADKEIKRSKSKQVDLSTASQSPLNQVEEKQKS